MTHRTFYIQIIILICLIGLHPPISADQGTPAIILENSSFDFGDEFEGNEVTHDFVFKNTGTADLEIKNVHSG